MNNQDISNERMFYKISCYQSKWITNLDKELLFTDIHDNKILKSSDNNSLHTPLCLLEENWCQPKLTYPVFIVVRKQLNKNQTLSTYSERDEAQQFTTDLLYHKTIFL